MPVPATRTVGVDLSAEPQGTAIACLRWHGGGAAVEALEVGCTDEVVLAWMHHEDRSVGIDCPFGWPVKFVDLVAHHAAGTLALPDAAPGWRREFVLRETDRWVHQHHQLVPLSVAADLIGHTALRLALLLSRMAPEVTVSLDGHGALAEVYPAAALKQWGLPHRGYKRSANLAARHALVDQLIGAAPWLEFGEFEATVRHSDDALDAVLCALVRRAVDLGRTTWPPTPEPARREGWIHVPDCSLADLVPR